MGVKIVACTRKGVAFARQAGAEAASGEIIVQADADTIYPRGWLTRIQKQFVKHPKAVAVAGTFWYSKPPWWGIFEYVLRIFFGWLSSWTLGRPYIISGANFAYYKKALMQIGGYRHGVYSSDQIDISTRLSKVGKIFYDGRSCCLTSERSVAKPVFQIIREFIRNLSYFAQHITKRPAAPVKKGLKKVASASTGTYLKIVVPLFLIGFLCYGYFIPASPVFGKVYYRSITSDKVIALTLDDGPNEPYTSQLLNVLKDADVKATFFLVGANVKLYPDTTRRILEEGHVIGNHSNTHNANHALSLNPGKDIAMAQQTIEEVTGIQPHLYRPPHGKKTPWELADVKNAGYVEVLWNIGTNELSLKSAEFKAEQIIFKAKPGGIILLHDGYGTQHNVPRAEKSETVTIASIIISRLQSEGYTFVTIPELFNVPAYNQVSE
jgi:peptidoglycan/xylan/chitin deacetylase (PgdA/CDA1 family)